MKIVRALFFVSVEFNIHISIRHLPGKVNLFADLLSRLQVQKFQVCPDAVPSATIIPHSLFDLFKTT